jgi:type I restriction enzyme S subunit
VKEIISVPQDQFENTSTKTSIVIFENTEQKTSNVKFRELVVERYDEDTFEEINDEIVLTENKGDIKGLKDRFVSTATKDEILANSICSLNGKDYHKKEIIVGKTFKLVCIGDLCESQNGYAFKTSEYSNDGIPLITITHIKNGKIVFNNNNFIKENDKYKKFEIKKNDVIITMTGKKPTLCSIAINYDDNKQYLNQRCAILRNFSYINSNYFVAIFNAYVVTYINENIGYGSNQDNISLTDILNIKIPIPKSEEKIEEWVNKISKPYDKKIKKHARIKELESEINNKIKEIEENEECEEVELREICDINPETLKKNQFDKINYVDISSVKDGKINDIQILTENFPSRAKRIVRKYDILYSTVRPNLKGYALMTSAISNCVVSTGFAVIRTKNIHHMYIYALITDETITEYLMNNISGSTYPTVDFDTIGKIKIKLPKNKKLLKSFDPLFEEIETLQNDIKDLDAIYNKYINELKEEAMPTQKKIKVV